MKILIVSDTHKKNENYFKVLEMHHPDMVIHCGDAEGSEYALSSAAECPVYIVLGNNDFFSDLPREITLDIGSYKVWVTHGHNYYVSMGNETIKKEAIDRGVDIVLYGHTVFFNICFNARIFHGYDFQTGILHDHADFFDFSGIAGREYDSSLHINSLPHLCSYIVIIAY